jgi:hypothetical protein
MSSLVLGLALSPAVAQAQGFGRMQGPRGPAGESAARVLALKGVLELTPAQITKLEQIQVRAKERTEPLVAKLEEARPERPGTGQLGRPGFGRGGVAMGRMQGQLGRPGPGRGGVPMFPGQGPQLQRRLHAPGAGQLTSEKRDSVREQMRTHMQQQRQEIQARREELRALTPEQREQLRAQHQEQRQTQREEMQARREQLQPVMEQLRANADATRGEVESVLTSAQLGKLQELRGAMRPQIRRQGR